MRRKETGDKGEATAAHFLREHGYRVLEKNYRCPRGEIDIVAQEKGCLVFVEVRTKTQTAFGAPEESITPVKQRKMLATAFWYLERHEALEKPWRIDMVAIEMRPGGEPLRIELITNAALGAD
jgi:putative endonuclease